jgi:hypothetical protein
MAQYWNDDQSKSSSSLKNKISTEPSCKLSPFKIFGGRFLYHFKGIFYEFSIICSEIVVMNGNVGFLNKQ